ncbi:class I SAM-dependent methyltransferase [Sneathiella sp. HT1-7]|uniref:class I SAM-dependent methyltransferase n=1 Tax=Sneathiella sp. HT1-7 TaxID=2887192 RepID=UPI001D15D9A8|nr:class I SAM-dependent methyltransferase [Sneathiella sp. HT1-7]MCC3305090.1 class I SAM-dependent methyltransferase [Sneathiella sp. HT1-7]
MSDGIDGTETGGAVGTSSERRTTWDERYAAPGFLFGTAPSAFLVEQKNYLVPDTTALAVADGEGRNSVFLAECGLKVTAMDASEVAVEKARALADAHGVSVDFHKADIFDWDWSATTYDFVVGIFIQFLSPDDRKAVFAGMKRALKPGGVLLLHGYRPAQVDYGTGGPPHRENMYTEAYLREAFDDMEILRLASYDREIAEGTGHAGMSALIDLVARKR